MALRYGFFNSIDGDRKYDAADMSSIFDGIIEDGVFASIGKIFAVTPGTGMQVVVDSGKAWFNHTWTTNDTPIPLNLEASDISLDRYDAVVLEVNNSEDVRANSIKVIKGKAASEPQKPSMTKTDLVNQYPLAYILVKRGTSTISSSEIEITVGKSECPFVTGPLETVPIDSLFEKWEGEFDTWFQNVQSQLEGDIATNLQRQIDERVKISDKASAEEAAAGIVDNKWMTPATVKKAIEPLNNGIPDSSSGERIDVISVPEGFVLSGIFLVIPENYTYQNFGYYNVQRKEVGILVYYQESGRYYSRMLIYSNLVKGMNNPSSTKNLFGNTSSTSKPTLNGFSIIGDASKSDKGFCINKDGSMAIYDVESWAETKLSSYAAEKSYLLPFIAQNYFGYSKYDSSNGRTTIHYKKLAADYLGEFTEVTLPTVSNSDKPVFISCIANLAYFLVQKSTDTWVLSTIDMTTGKYTEGVKTYSFATKGWSSYGNCKFRYLFRDGNKIYLMLFAGAIPCRQIFIFDDSSGTITDNWSGLNSLATELNGIVSQTPSYIGNTKSITLKGIRSYIVFDNSNVLALFNPSESVPSISTISLTSSINVNLDYMRLTRKITFPFSGPFLPHTQVVIDCDSGVCYLATGEEISDTPSKMGYPIIERRGALSYYGSPFAILNGIPNAPSPCSIRSPSSNLVEVYSDLAGSIWRK